MKIHNKLNPEIHNKLLILGFIRVNPKRCNFSVFQKTLKLMCTTELVVHRSKSHAATTPKLMVPQLGFYKIKVTWE